MLPAWSDDPGRPCSTPSTDGMRVTNDSGRDPSPFSEDEHALPRGLGIEEPIGLVGLLEAPTMGEQTGQGHLSVGHEPGALFLADVREGPRSVHCELAA